MNTLIVVGIIGMITLLAAAIAGTLIRRGLSSYRVHVTLAIIAVLIGAIHAFLAISRYW